ncbi:MAG: ABC transporter substrate-binding protein [Planctomycetaceae bacterium]|nr:ABC transporter substrate-binding protein [Planctomycetaceae bacterium]
MRKPCLVILALLMLCSVGLAGEKKFRIALCNDYAGNSWRQTMIADWNKAAAVAMEMGLIEEAPVFTTNESSAAEQAAQLQSLVLDGYDAIVLDAASPTALNAAVRDVLDNDIVLVSFDNAVTEPRAWRLVTDFDSFGIAEIDFIAGKFPDGANLLEVRGLPGSFADEAVHGGVEKGMAKHPNLTIVNTVYGHWTQSIAQKEVAGILPSLPKIDAVAAQGGDGYGIYQAFKAAGRDLPLIVFGNRYDELELWKELRESQNYDTMSLAIAPGSCTVAFWTALEILLGNDVPKEILLPPHIITADKLDHYLQTTEKGGVATIMYTQDWTRQMIDNAKAGLPPPPDPE